MQYIIQMLKVDYQLGTPPCLFRARGKDIHELMPIASCDADR